MDILRSLPRDQQQRFMNGVFGVSRAEAKFAQQLILEFYPDALAAAVEACNLSLRHLAPDHPALAPSFQMLAEVCERAGNYTAAEPLLQEAREVVRRSRGEENALYATVLAMLAGVHRDRWDLAAALPLYQQAREIFKRVAAENDPLYVQIGRAHV